MIACVCRFISTIKETCFRVARGYLTRSRMNRTKVAPVVSVSKTGKRVLLSPRWRFQKGDVDINYQKLNIKSVHKIDQDENFLDLKMFNDLTRNDLDYGLKGKHVSLNNVENFDIARRIKEDKIRESTKELNNAATMRRNDLKRQLENAKAKAAVDADKNRVRREKAKRNDFSLQMKRSLDAARAVDVAYLAKERQNTFNSRIQQNKAIKENVDRTKLIVKDYRDEYQTDACGKNLKISKIKHTHN